MKKVLMIVAIVAGTSMMTSCKKDFDCTCTDLLGQNPVDKVGNGKDATAACEDAETKLLGVSTNDCKPK